MNEQKTRPASSAIKRARIFERIEACGEGGATCDEVEQALAMIHQTASARILELAQVGRIIDTGRRRPTRTGRNARVYVTVKEQADAHR